MHEARYHVLFVCVENSNRSQMAEGFARYHGRDDVAAYSAGSRPSGVVNPMAIAAMLARGIDINRHKSKSLEDLPAVEWDAVVTMGCGDSCPHLPARFREDWPLPDPKLMEPNEFNRVRDEIEQRVLDLLTKLSQEK